MYLFFCVRVCVTGISFHPSFFCDGVRCRHKKPCALKRIAMAIPNELTAICASLFPVSSLSMVKTFHFKPTCTVDTSTHSLLPGLTVYMWVSYIVLALSPLFWFITRTHPRDKHMTHHGVIPPLPLLDIQTRSSVKRAKRGRRPRPHSLGNWPLRLRHAYMTQLRWYWMLSTTRNDKLQQLISTVCHAWRSIKCKLGGEMKGSLIISCSTLGPFVLLMFLLLKWGKS